MFSIYVYQSHTNFAVLGDAIMGWKYDEDRKEWITTEEWNDRAMAQTIGQLGCIAIACAAFAVVFAPILPARMLKWAFGYGFWPDEWSFWQFTGDLCLSLPFYAMLIALIWVVRAIRA